MNYAHQPIHHTFLHQHRLPLLRAALMLIAALLLATPAAARGKAAVHFFARYECSRETVVSGDSVLVSLVLYADQPFQQARRTSKPPHIRGGHARTVAQRGERQQQRVRLADGVYYAVIYERYVVGSERAETLKFPKQKFDASFIIYDEAAPQNRDPYSTFDPFAGFDPFGLWAQPQPRSTHSVRAKCTSSDHRLTVTPRPRRSVEEVIHSGARIL